MKTLGNRYRDRKEAGLALAALLGEYANRSDVLVLGLPRGGVPVAAEIARGLNCALDVLVVRKLGMPGQEELAMGAIATGGVRQLSREVIAGGGVSAEEVEAVTRRERAELERREAAYRAGRPPLDVKGRIVIVADDGLATGATMRAAIQALRKMGAERFIVAVPVGSIEACRDLAREADEVVCPKKPRDLIAISLWYDDFRQVADEEVRELLGNEVPAARMARTRQEE